MAAEPVRRDRRSTNQRRSLATRTPSETNREPQEVPQEIQQEIPQENSERHPDNMFKVIPHTRIKFHNAEFDGAGNQVVGGFVIADIVKVKDAVEELDLHLPENTNSDPSVALEWTVCHLADPTPRTGYEPNFCIDGSEQTPINFPSKSKSFNLEQQASAGTQHHLHVVERRFTLQHWAPSARQVLKSLYWGVREIEILNQCANLVGLDLERKAETAVRGENKYSGGGNRKVRKWLIENSSLSDCNHIKRIKARREKINLRGEVQRGIDFIKNVPPKHVPRNWGIKKSLLRRNRSSKTSCNGWVVKRGLPRRSYWSYQWNLFSQWCDGWTEISHLGNASWKIPRLSGISKLESQPQDWKKLKTADLHLAIHWIKEVEIDELMKSRLIVARTGFLDFVMLDVMIASALKKLLNTQRHFRKSASVEEQRAQKDDRFSRGRQIAYMIYAHFRATRAHEAVQHLSDLFNMLLHNDDVQDFDVRWDEAPLSVCEIPTELVFEGLYKSNLQDCVGQQ